MVSQIHEEFLDASEWHKSSWQVEMYSLTSTSSLHSANAELVNVLWHMSSLGEKKKTFFSLLLYIIIL